MRTHGTERTHGTRSARAVAAGAAAALLLALCLPSAARAVTIPTDVVQLPPSDTVTLDLGTPPGVGAWVRLRPDDPTDPVQDFSSFVGGSFLGGSATPSDPLLFDLTFQVTWNGTIDGTAPEGVAGTQLLFAILDARLGSGNTFDTTSDLPTSGFVRNGFALDGMSVTPEIVQDDFGTITGMGQGFVGDCTDQVGGCNTWLGFVLPADTSTHQITARWALGQSVPAGSDFFFPNAAFVQVAEVPEPGTLLLLGIGLALGAIRRTARA